jgi:hypothetical protein
MTITAADLLDLSADAHRGLVEGDPQLTKLHAIHAILGLLQTIVESLIDDYEADQLFF